MLFGQRETNVPFEHVFVLLLLLLLSVCICVTHFVNISEWCDRRKWRKNGNNLYDEEKEFLGFWPPSSLLLLFDGISEISFVCSRLKLISMTENTSGIALGNKSARIPQHTSSMFICSMFGEGIKWVQWTRT